MKSRRVASVDILRGAVMVLMAIDHVRVYAGVPPGGPDPAVFFTRWVTHFCAPVFIFLAGTSAYLVGQKHASRGALSRWLATRGLFLVLVELTVLRFFWTFNADWQNFTFAGVIWVIGWCMVIMSALVWLPFVVITAIGALVVFGHNAVGSSVREFAARMDGGIEAFIALIYAGGAFGLTDNGPRLVVLYTIIPWIGVMALGYAFGAVLRMETGRRDRLCMLIGGGAIALFLLLRSTRSYGDPWAWESGLLSFLGTTKYPASLQFLLMTLGPAILLVPLLEKARGKVVEWLTVFGKVPFFYYLLHIPLIHLVAIGVSAVRTPESTGWLFANHPMMPPDVPEGYMWSLPLLYGVTIIVVLLLYPLCRWYARVKETSSNPIVRLL
jgi:uncharacterized membrane protein